ncbi:hypothetical protein K9L97_00135 [Candidatus Woesearchaeota archaeon]|nr:hypothetical protein [Candidatus Woesearchaeota archaeon]
MDVNLNVDFKELWNSVQEYFGGLNRMEILGYSLLLFGVICLIVGAILW